MVAVRSPARAVSLVSKEVEVVDDPFLIVNHPDFDVVVEVIGGAPIAKSLCCRQSPMANIHGAMNAVMGKSDAAGVTMYAGAALLHATA